MYENFGNFLLIIFTISKIDFTIKKPILGRKQESMASETTWESMASETTRARARPGPGPGPEPRARARARAGQAASP